MSFFLAPALEKLRAEVNDRFPNRDKASDGWIGDASHSARKSDHNPCWSCSGRSNGIVRALDIDISPDGRPKVDLRKRLLKILIGDPRVWYVISNGIIYSRTYNWVPRRYTGSNPHFQHVHVSLNGANGVDSSGNFDTSSWFPQPKPPKRDESPRIENFRKTAPEWNVNILDRAIKGGRQDLVKHVNAIEEAVRELPNEEDTRISRFKERFEQDRVLEMMLLNEAVDSGRVGTVKRQRDAIRRALKRVLWV